MGLLDKASTRQTPVTGGLLSKIEHAKEPGKPIIAQNSVAVEKQIEKVEVSFSHRVKKKTAGPGKPVTKVDTPGIIKLLAGIADLSPSLEGIAELFELLKQAFTIQKGALLTRTADTDFFLPRAQTGLDITSRNRLRLPSEILDQQHSSGIWLVPDDLDLIQPYLSSREFSLLEEIIILPVFSDNYCSGLVMILADEPGDLHLQQSIPADELQPVQNALGSYFNRIKLFQITKASESSNGAAELEDFIIRMNNQNMVFSAVKFNIAPLLKRLQAVSHDVDVFRARKDTLRIIETLFEGSSILVSLDTDRYLLLLGTKRQQNHNLLQHQVGLALQNFFSDNKTVLEFTPVPAPAAGASPKQAASDLLSAG